MVSIRAFRPRGAVFGLAISLLLPSVSGAQGPTDDTAKAKQLFLEGSAKFEKGKSLEEKNKLEEAREHYRNAAADFYNSYGLHRAGALKFNMARCYDRLAKIAPPPLDPGKAQGEEDSAHAHRYYSEAQQELPPGDPDAAVAAERIAKIEAEFPRLKPKVVPPPDPGLAVKPPPVDHPPETPTPPEKPLHKKGWFLGTVIAGGVVVLGVVVGASVAATTSKNADIPGGDLPVTRVPF